MPFRAQRALLIRATVSFTLPIGYLVGYTLPSALLNVPHLGARQTKVQL